MCLSDHLNIFPQKKHCFFEKQCHFPPAAHCCRSEQIQHIVQIDFFPDVQLIPGFRHIVEQELQNQRTAKSPPLDLELGKSHGQVDIFYGVRTDKSRIGHRFGKQIAALCIRSRAVMLPAAFSEIFAADGFVTALPVPAAKPAAFIAQKFHFVPLPSGQCIPLRKRLIQPEIRHDIAEILPVDLPAKILKIRQNLGGRGNKIEPRILLL